MMEKYELKNNFMYYLAPIYMMEKYDLKNNFMYYQMHSRPPPSSVREGYHKLLFVHVSHII